jgi:hypothetical protein
VLTGALPFSSQDLEQAIALRLLDGSTLPGKLEVIAQGADRIEVRLGGRRRIVEIGSSREDMVTRLVRSTRWWLGSVPDGAVWWSDWTPAIGIHPPCGPASPARVPWPPGQCA